MQYWTSCFGKETGGIAWFSRLAWTVPGKGALDGPEFARGREVETARTREPNRSGQAVPEVAKWLSGRPQSVAPASSRDQGGDPCCACKAWQDAAGPALARTSQVPWSVWRAHVLAGSGERSVWAECKLALRHAWSCIHCMVLLHPGLKPAEPGRWWLLRATCPVGQSSSRAPHRFSNQIHSL